MEIKEYKRYIAALANSASKSIFLNSSAEHAACVMSNIFRKSERKLRIYARNLNGDVSSNSDYTAQMYLFLKERGSVDILLTDKKPDVYPFGFYVLNDFPDKVRIKHAPQPILTTSDSGSEVNFTIGDESMIRIEHDADNYLAYGSFSFSETNKWIKYFDTQFKKATDNIDISL